MKHGLPVKLQVLQFSTTLAKQVKSGVPQKPE